MNFSGNTWHTLTLLAPALMIGSAVASFLLILALHPLLQRYAMARPNARSSHCEPTPQGAGIAVIAATTAATLAAALIAPSDFGEPCRLALIFAGVIALAAIGVTDDIHPLEAAPRLLLQTIVVIVVLATLPTDLRIIFALPWWIERALLFFGLLWFVNLVNFMDGIDWMTVVEVVPLTAALSLFGLMGALPSDATLVSLAICGAMIGFAPFNRPVARLFLGDVGSLPIGLLLGWMLVLLAGRGHLAAALLLPLYYLADATITLLRRLANGEPVMQAHRSHFYQRAMTGGFSVYKIVGRVFAANIGLMALATATVMTSSLVLHILMLAAGTALVSAILWTFNRAR